MKKLLKKLFPTLYENGDLRYLYKNSRYKLYFEILFFIVGFFITWCFGNFLSPEFYGTYLFITNTIQFFSFLSFSGINQSLIQSVASGYDRFYITATKKIFLYSISGTIALLIYGMMYSVLIDYNPVILISLIIAGVFFPFMNSMNNYQFFLDGKSDFKRTLRFRLINYLILVTFLILLIFVIKNLVIYFILVSGVQLLANIYFTKICINQIKSKQRDAILETKALKYGINLTKFGIITLICLNINNLIIGFFYGPSALAFYTIGKGLPSKIGVFIKPSFSVLLTRYSEKETNISKRFFILLIIGSILLFLGILFLMPFYLQILFPAYVTAMNYGIAYSFIILLIPIVVVLGYYFRGKTDIKVIRNAQVIPDILSLILIIPLLLLFGIYGLILDEFLRFFFRIIIYVLYRKKIDFSE